MGGKSSEIGYFFREIINVISESVSEIDIFFIEMSLIASPIQKLQTIYLRLIFSDRLFSTAMQLTQVKFTAKYFGVSDLDRQGYRQLLTNR